MGGYIEVRLSALSEFGSFGKGVGIDRLVVSRAISRHRDILSEEYLISVVSNATDDETKDSFL
jgi:hypothetical protein